MLHLWFCCPMVVGRVRSVSHLLCHHLLFVLKGTLRYMLIESPYKSRHHPNFIHFCLIRLFPTISHHQSFPSNKKLWVFKTCQTFNFWQIPCTLETNIAPAHSCLDKIFLRWNMSRGYVEIPFVHLFFFFSWLLKSPFLLQVFVWNYRGSMLWKSPPAEVFWPPTWRRAAAAMSNGDVKLKMICGTM